MDLSIILVNYNSKAYLASCLSSIKQLSNSLSLETIVVDNASTDGSQEMIVSSYPKVSLIKNSSNLGFGKANNLGIQLAKGKYILLLNNDTTLKNDALTILVQFLDKNQKAGIVTSKLYESSGKIQKNCRSFPVTPFDTMFGRASLLSKLFPNNPITRKNTMSTWDYKTPRQVDWVSGAAMMVKREVFDRIGLLDENIFMYWEDTDFCKRAKDAGWEIWFTPEAEIIHYTGLGGGRRSLWLKLFTIYHMHWSAYYYFRKHYYKNIFHPMAILCLIGMITLISFKATAAIISSLFSSN
jgi:GT2 family glycosyltransferase